MFQSWGGQGRLRPTADHVQNIAAPSSVPMDEDAQLGCSHEPGVGISATLEERASIWHEIARKAWQAAVRAGHVLVVACPAGLPAPPCGALTSDERERAARFLRDDDRQTFVSARQLVRFLLGLSAAPFSYAKNGKPFVDGAPAFSISHSKNLVAIAFCPNGLGDQLGIDLEFIDKNYPIDDAINLVCHPNEIAFIEGLPDVSKRSAFFRCWTRKEAALKAVGGGLPSSRSVDVSLCRNNPVIDGPPPMRIWDLSLDDDWAMALAAPVQVEEMLLLRFNRDACAPLRLAAGPASGLSSDTLASGFPGDCYATRWTGEN
jgi:4'-phosphopantetheinyl transferase